jgi:hypothetical protein
MSATISTGSFVLAQPRSIVVIAPDLGLRQALTFALEVEGFVVHAFEEWSGDALLRSPTLCFVVDDEIVRTSTDARDDLMHLKRGVILLTDGISAPLDRGLGVSLAKP